VKQNSSFRFEILLQLSALVPREATDDGAEIDDVTGVERLSATDVGLLDTIPIPTPNTDTDQALLYRGWFVVVHRFSHLCADRWHHYRVQNFNFLRTYYYDFLNNVYRKGSVFCFVKWVIGPAGIAVPQSRH